MAVVAETSHDAAERSRTGVEDRPACVVLEPDDRLLLPWLELALDEHVADKSRVAGDGVQREDGRAGLLMARLVAIKATEELIATADREHNGAVRNGF